MAGFDFCVPARLFPDGPDLFGVPGLKTKNIFGDDFSVAMITLASFVLGAYLAFCGYWAWFPAKASGLFGGDVPPAGSFSSLRSAVILYLLITSSFFVALITQLNKMVVLMAAVHNWCEWLIIGTIYYRVLGGFKSPPDQEPNNYFERLISSTEAGNPESRPLSPGDGTHDSESVSGRGSDRLQQLQAAAQVQGESRRTSIAAATSPFVLSVSDKESQWNRSASIWIIFVMIGILCIPDLLFSFAFEEVFGLWLDFQLFFASYVCWQRAGKWDPEAKAVFHFFWVASAAHLFQIFTLLAEGLGVLPPWPWAQVMIIISAIYNYGCYALFALSFDKYTAPGGRNDDVEALAVQNGHPGSSASGPPIRESQEVVNQAEYRELKWAVKTIALAMLFVNYSIQSLFEIVNEPFRLIGFVLLVSLVFFPVERYLYRFYSLDYFCSPRNIMTISLCFSSFFVLSPALIFGDCSMPAADPSPSVMVWTKYELSSDVWPAHFEEKLASSLRSTLQHPDNLMSKVCIGLLKGVCVSGIVTRLQFLIT